MCIDADAEDALNIEFFCESQSSVYLGEKIRVGQVCVGIGPGVRHGLGFRVSAVPE